MNGFSSYLLSFGCVNNYNLLWINETLHQTSMLRVALNVHTATSVYSIFVYTSLYMIVHFFPLE